MTLKSGKLIIDTQFGSTGKGLIAGYFASRDNPDTLITAWAPNAGHSYIDNNGRKFIHTMLANGVVSTGLKRILMGPGSLINLESLENEIVSCADLIGPDVEIWIHPHAAIVTQKHIDEEQGPMTKIGSTKKGVGAAMIDRIRRNPDDNNVAANLLKYVGMPGEHRMAMYVSPTVQHFNAQMELAEVVQIEGAQGYSLSMYHGLYPYTTSRDVTPAQIFADCAIPLHWYKDIAIIGTLRTFPIRVANRFDDKGAQVGYSGGCYPDQREMSWSDFGMKPELTTVTKLPRRIFSFSPLQLEEAARQCSTDTLFVNFMNYLRTEDELLEMMMRLERFIPVGNKFWLGFGPADADVMEVGPDTPLASIRMRWLESRARIAGSQIVDSSGNVIVDDASTLMYSGGSPYNTSRSPVH